MGLVDQYKDRLISGLISKGFEVKHNDGSQSLYAKRRGYEISLSFYSNDATIHKLSFECGRHYVRYIDHKHEFAMNLYTPYGDFSIAWINCDLYGDIWYEDLMLLAEKPVEFAIQFVGEHLPLSAEFLAELRSWNDDKTAEINEC